MNSTLKGLRPASACAPNEFGLQRPSADGRLYASNEFDLEGPPANGRPAPTEKYSPRRRRLTPGAQAPQKADFNRREGRRPAWGAPNEFGLQGPVANGRPAPTEKYSPRRRRPTPGAQAPRKADFNRREGLRPTVGLRRPKRHSLRRRRPTPGAQAPRKADFNRREGLRPTVGFTRRMNSTLRAFGRRSACADRKKRPPRRRRPTPGAQAPEKADFNRREGLRPAVGLRRPTNTLRVGEGRRPARKRLGRPISIGAKAFGQRSACADRQIRVE
jgi:hypothetical protein